MKSKQVTLLSVLLVAVLFVAGARFASAQGSAQAANCAETYTVVAGDTLGALAQKYLGSNSLYQQIADATNAANKVDSTFAAIADPNIIEIGWKLCIPAKAAGAATTPAAAGTTTTPTAATPAATSPTAVPTASVPPLTLAQLGNATYQVQDAPGGSVTLKDGKAEVEIAPGSASKYTAQIAEPVANGNINSKPYAAAVLITSGGGSGSFYNLAVVPNNNGQPGTGMTKLLGDRIKVQAISFVNNTIQVDYLDRKEGDAMTAEPTVAVTKYYTIDAAGALVETQAPAPTATTTTTAPTVGTGFAGTWLSSSPAADASALLKTLVLGQDGNAAISNNYVGKGVTPATGTWTQTSENTATVTFTKSDDQNINDQLTFQMNGDVLTAVQYNQSMYGENAPTFNRATGLITGTVSYLQKIALPDNAVVEVYLVDATDANAPVKYLSGISYTTHGKQAPLEFAVPYAGSQIQASGKYLVQAFISADGKLLFKNSNGVAVLTNGAPTSGVEIIVEPPTQ